MKKNRNRSRSIVYGLSGLAAGLASTVHAGDMLDQVTVTATRIESPIGDVPATVSVYSSERIDTLLAQDIKDLVRFEPGVSVRSSPARFTAAGSSTGRDGNSGFNVRGLEGNRVLIQVDGVRAPDAYSFGAQSVGRGDYVELGVLKSVEIVRGPASALYGSDGLAGSVSFITKDPADVLGTERNWSLRATAGYASADEQFSQGLIGAARFGALETLVAYSHRDGEGQDTRGANDAANTDRTTPNPQDNRSSSVLAKAIYSINDANRVRLTFDHRDRDVDWTVLSAIAKPPLTATSTLGLTAWDEVDRDRIALDYEFTGDGNALRGVQVAVYYQDTDTRQHSEEDRNTAPDRIRDATFDTVVRGANLQMTSGFATGAVEHELVYGFDYSTTRTESVRNGTVPPIGESFPSHGFPTTDHVLAGAFVQDQVSIGRWSFFPALRWDFYEIDPQNDPLFVAAVPAGQDDTHLTPKLGIVFQVNEQVSLFANAAAGFKAPAPSQVNNGFTNPIANYRSESNPDLQPETSETIELGARARGGRWSATVAAFAGRYDDFIEQIQTGGTFTPNDPAVFQYVNLTEAKIYGAEASGRVELGAGFAVNAAASFARGDSQLDGVETPLPSVDPFKLVSGLEWRDSVDRVGAQAYVTYSDSKSPARAGVSCTPSCFIPDSFVVADLVGWWNVTDAMVLRAGVFNITDEKYWWWGDVRGLSATSPAVDAYSQPGRNASVSLSVRF
ncbi:MAG TPA: TonB-dependent hemoglobin/transferrin/lactoferrin family receptor [Steroidobacteraceae bacterium]|nr:TonB-dependent hemoglobin/transferrin/lactoferrin family receptor [Steroidobacteraceae bacterium]